MQYQPHTYQQKATEAIIDNPRFALFLDCGLGKTVSTLTAINELMLNSFEISRVLVIAPKRVAEMTWSEELCKWDHLSNLSVAVAVGTKAERIAAINLRAMITTINRENVIWLLDYLKMHKLKWDFDMVVLDELSSFKDSKSKRFRALKQILPKVKRVVGLTATPAPNNLQELWPELFLIDAGQRLGKTVTAFRNRWFTPGRRNGPMVYEWLAKNGAEEEIYSAISDVTLSMQACDYLDMPERIDNRVYVDLSPAEMVKYRELEKHFLLDLDGEVVVANSKAVVGNKLLQLANGSVYGEYGDRAIKVHDHKLDALEELIEAQNGRPVIVYYSYKFDLEAILSRFPSAIKLDNTRTIEAWNAGKVPILLVHPASAGHGLNLQAGGSTIIWYGLTWSLELYLQACARLWRQGQKQTVIVHHILARGTVDERVMQALAKKDMNQNALLQALKEEAYEE